jgi:hypothetical protein
MLTATIYFHEHHQYHAILAEVNEVTGAHQVIRSILEYHPKQTRQEVVKSYSIMLGENSIRVYVCQPFVQDIDHFVDDNYHFARRKKMRNESSQ